MARSLFGRVVAVLGTIFWSPAPAVVAADVDRIEGQEAKRQVEKGEAIIVDVRSKAAWDMGHVEGALHVPGEELAARLSQLPKNKLIITYCTWAAEATSARAALKLKEAGFAKVAALKGGMAAWQQAGGKVTAAVTPGS